jgi:hypothetical protein
MFQKSSSDEKSITIFFFLGKYNTKKKKKNKKQEDTGTWRQITTETGMHIHGLKVSPMPFFFLKQ